MKGKENFTYTEQTSEYVVHLKKKNYWWLLLFLLLLLPLILLINFKKDVYIKTIDAFDKNSLSDSYVEFTYHDKQLFNFKTKEFLTSDTVILRGSTDSSGVIIFENVSYTLYSRIFCARQKANILATNDCFMGDSIMPYFHKIRNKKEVMAELSNRTYDYDFLVKDIDDLQPIPNADVSGNGTSKDGDKNWKAITDPAGVAILEKFPYCGEYEVIGSCYGYENDTLTGDARFLYGDLDSNRTLHLTPIKKMIKFIVKDLETKQPIPNATAYLVIDGDTIQTVTTNVNGYASIVGEGTFEDVHIIELVTIIASKAFYNDTSVTTVVDDFIQLEEDERVLYIRPTLQDVEFRDTDGSTGLSGVKNIITVNGIQRATEEYSNTNGKFMVAGVLSSDKVSITASKTGYNTNSTTIKNKLFSDLVTSASKRDIPLTIVKDEEDPPQPPRDDEEEAVVDDEEIPDVPVVPCDAPQESGGEGVTIKVHSVGGATKFVIKWDMYSIPDQLIVYCGTGSSKKQLFNTKKAVSGSGQATLKCSSNYITVKVIGSDDTQWQYQMECN